MELVRADEETVRLLLDPVGYEVRREAVERRLGDLRALVLGFAGEGHNSFVGALPLREVAADGVEVADGPVDAARNHHGPRQSADLLHAPRVEHDERFAVGFMVDSVWHQCMVTIEDEDTPRIDHVGISSTPVDGYAYRAGESIDVGVTLDGKVEVDGTPLLALFLGDGNDSAWRGAEYYNGSGTRFLVFR